jgi:hypothetical protein
MRGNRTINSCSDCEKLTQLLCSVMALVIPRLLQPSPAQLCVCYAHSSVTIIIWSGSHQHNCLHLGVCVMTFVLPNLFKTTRYTN